MDTVAQMRDYLARLARLKRASKARAHSLRFGCIEGMVLAEGVSSVNVLPCPAGLRGPARGCFKNATDASNGVGRIYCEGFAVRFPGGFPVEHAWLLTPEGEVVDPTWEPPGVAYLGVPFKDGYLRRFVLARHAYGLMDDRERARPLMRLRRSSTYRHPAFPLGKT